MYVLRTMWGLCSRRPVRWTVAIVGGALWWWAVLRLAVQPAQAGPVEGAVAAGGWSLGLIPLRATPRVASARRVLPAVPGARLPGPRGSALPEDGRLAVPGEDFARHKG